MNSYFSGAGLFDMGLILGGLDIQHSFELDKVACQVQRHNLGGHVHTVDITQKLVMDDDYADVMVGTYPCTRYSTISDISGTRTGDDLFLHFFRHVAIREPELFIVENVPGLKKFPVVMEAMTALPNYYVSVHCPIQAQTWLPQKRDRLIIIGSKKPFNWQEPVCRNPKRLSDILEKDPRITIPKSIITRLKGHYRDRPIISDPAKNDLAPTCMAHYAKDKGTRLVVDKRFQYGARPYSVREWARLQGVPDWFEFNCSDSQAYKMIGNGVPVPIGHWCAKELQRYWRYHYKTVKLKCA